MSSCRSYNASAVEEATGVDSATAAELIALRDALVRAVTSHSHHYTCSAARGMERDCTCGWLEVRELVKVYQPGAKV